MKIWKIGIIGTGMIADFHAQAIQSLPNTQLAGFCNVRPEKAKKMAEKYGVIPKHVKIGRRGYGNDCHTQWRTYRTGH